MSDVKHWIYYTPWSDETDCLISIFQVLNQKSKFKTHMNRIKKADLEYPLIIVEDTYDKKGVILDGNHRFAKMILENKENIKIVYLKLKN